MEQETTKNRPKLEQKESNSHGRIQTYIAVASFGMAVLFGIAGFITPPPGQIHDSILYLIAQFLLVTTSIFGVSAVISNGRWTVSNK